MSKIFSILLIILFDEFGASLRASNSCSFCGSEIFVEFINFIRRALVSFSLSFLNNSFLISICGFASVKASNSFPFFVFLIELMITSLRTFKRFLSVVGIGCSASVRAIGAFSFFVKLESTLF